MSSTWFKSVSALKVQIDYRKNGYPCTNYVLIAETAESNVVNHNGGHDYSKWILAEGEYDEVMRKVFAGAIDFDNGMSKWKPNAKDSVGFIRMCKKALETAVEATELPYYLTGYVFWGASKHYGYIFDLFEKVEGIEKRKFYGEDVLVAKDIATYIINKRRINMMIEDYKERVISEANTMPFKDWIVKHKDWYKFAFETMEA